MNTCPSKNENNGIGAYLFKKKTLGWRPEKQQHRSRKSGGNIFQP